MGAAAQGVRSVAAADLRLVYAPALRKQSSAMGETKRGINVVIGNPFGLHFRPADLFARLANQFDSEIRVIKDEECVDGKSILSLTTLAAVKGTQLTIEATGHDAQAALDALADLVNRNFAEEESD